MRRHRHLTIAALAALALSGCGDEENGIPSDESRALRESLQDVKRALAEPECEGIDTSMAAVEARVQQLPDDIDEDVRQSIEDGVEELRDLAAAECAGATEPETEPETTPTPPPVPEPEAPAPPPTTPEPPPDDDEGPPPPDEDGGPGPGDGNGNGNGTGGTGPPGQEKREKPADDAKEQGKEE